MEEMGKSADETREKILEAATTEFSGYGIAGARVDRIAQISGGNKGLIYIYYGSKEALFLAVLERQLDRIYEEVIFTPEDIAGYAGALFDFCIRNPNLMRLMAWRRLEGSAPELAERGVKFEVKREGIRLAATEGTLARRFAPEFLMLLIMAVSTMLTAINPFAEAFDPGNQSKLAEYRTDVVRLMTTLFNEKLEKD